MCYQLETSRTAAGRPKVCMEARRNERRRRLLEADRSLRSTHTGVSGPPRSLRSKAQKSLRLASGPKPKPLWTPLRKSTGDSDRSLRPDDEDNGVSAPKTGISGLTGVSGTTTPESPALMTRIRHEGLRASAGLGPCNISRIPKVPLARGRLYKYLLLPQETLDLT